MWINHGINSKSIPIGEEKRISEIRTREDFHSFMEWYGKTCPEDYFDRIEAIKAHKPQTVKFKAGDIFRCDYDRFHYSYGLILGKIRQIEKWDVLPKEHSFRILMCQPIMVRMYDFITTRDDMSWEELQNIPLRDLDICVDDDIFRGIYPVVAHKRLVPSDIQFHFVCSKILKKDHHKTLFTDDFLIQEGFVSRDREFNLYIEWGFAQVEVSSKDISEELKEFMKEYWDGHGGTRLGISGHDFGKSEEAFLKEYPKHVSNRNLLNEDNKDNLKLIFRTLGISEESNFDDFAKLYGGITRQEFIDRIQGYEIEA